MAAKKSKSERREVRSDDGQGEESANARLVSDARDAVRRTQRIASQLHQLIAASITLGSLRSEPELLTSLANSTRGVFDAEMAVVTLESGALAPLRGVARRGKISFSEDPRSTSIDGGAPSAQPGRRSTWVDGDWLVAPILERRDNVRGVVAFRREHALEFATEDKEVLTLLAQMAATSLGAVELSRTIQNSEARLRVLVETAPVGIVEVDLEGNVLWWNHRAGRILAWPELVDSSEAARPAFPESALAGLGELWSDVLASASVSGRDLDDVEIAQRRRELTTSAALLPATGDRPPSILTLIDDVTDSRELKAEVRHAHTMEMRGQVASRIAHDFNNLLTLITGYAEMLSRNLEDNERDLGMVRDIQATASRASLLTGQLQSIGRTKARERVVFDPVAVIHSNSEVIERVLGGAIELQWELDERARNVRVDPDQFEQLILNLAINARDAMPDGGRLRIAVAPTTLSTAEASARAVEPGKYVRLVVSDTGVGMDEETLRKCFDPLFTTKGPFKGTGMGLAAARRFVEESGGAIWCTSTPGKGTTFEAIFPATTDEAHDVTVGAGQPRPRGSATILLAEDDDQLRRMCSQVLQRNGYTVIECESAEEALGRFAEDEGAIEVLLSDVVMGEMDGRALASALQSTRPELRVLLMSGTEDASIITGLDLANSDFLAKPFKPSQLIDKVHDLLTRRN